MSEWYASGGRWYNDEKGKNISTSEAYVQQVDDRDLQVAAKGKMLRYSPRKIYNDARIIKELADENN